MRIHFVGNGQVTRLASMFQRSAPKARCLLTQTGAERGAASGAALRAQLDLADIVVLQVPAAPVPGGLPPEEIRTATQGEVITLPDIHIDGLASLERDGTAEGSPILGQAELLRGARDLDRGEVQRRFLAGEIDMRQPARLAAALARLRRLEQASCDLRISDAIEEMARHRPILYGAGAPTPALLHRLFERLCDYLGLDPDAGMAWDPAFQGSLALPRALRAFTPWDVRALGLAYEADSHWHSQAITLVQRVLRGAEVPAALEG